MPHAEIAVSTTALCDVDKSTRVLSAEIRPRSAAAAFRGRARTVRVRGDFFGVVRALETAEPRDVLMVDGGGLPIAYAGELFARAALEKGIAAIVVDGGYRDTAAVAQLPLPVWSRSVTPMAGATRELGVVDVPVVCGGVTVLPGEIVVGDADGIVVLDPSEVDAKLAAARNVETVEGRVQAHLAAGGAIGDALNVAEHAAKLTAGEPSTLRFTV
jgi:regulator of RNase E activity RraA